MYYKFKYQNDDYLINLDKIVFIIKSDNIPQTRIFIGLSDRNLEFYFNNEKQLDKFYEGLQNAIIENFKIKEEQK